MSNTQIQRDKYGCVQELWRFFVVQQLYKPSCMLINNLYVFVPVHIWTKKSIYDLTSPHANSQVHNSQTTLNINGFDLAKSTVKLMYGPILYNLPLVVLLLLSALFHSFGILLWSHPILSPSTPACPPYCFHWDSSSSQCVLFSRARRQKPNNPWTTGMEKYMYCTK